MLEFLNQSIREDFHLLPIDKQMEFQRMAERLFSLGESVKILYVDPRKNDLEISVRIYKKFDVSTIG